MKDEHVNDISNYQKLYMQYAPMLLRFAGKFISPFFAEDIVHDVFLKIWDKQVFLLSESEVKNMVLIYISTLEILPSSEGFLFNYTYL